MAGRTWRLGDRVWVPAFGPREVRLFGYQRWQRGVVELMRGDQVQVRVFSFLVWCHEDELRSEPGCPPIDGM